MRVFVFQPTNKEVSFPGVIVFTEIYQVTMPLKRFCVRVASEGYIVLCPESYHEFEPKGCAIPYDDEGTARGNKYKVDKVLAAYDTDARACIDHFKTMKQFNGRIGCVGMCLGGHISFRCAFNKEVSASVCFFPTDIHSETLGKGKKSDSLARANEIEGETLIIFGRQDPHIPAEGRLKIYQRLTECNTDFQWCEFNAQHAFVRDEGSKGRFDAPLTQNCMTLMFETFHRRLQLKMPSTYKIAAKI